MITKRVNGGNFKTARVRAQGNFSGAVKMAATYFLLFLQPVILLALYSFIAYFVPLFFYISLGLTAVTAVYIAVKESAHAKCGWLLLMLVSCGCGYIIYILANRKICFGGSKAAFDLLYARSAKYVKKTNITASPAVKSDCEYLFRAGGFAAYTDTEIRYFSGTSALAEDMLRSFESAQNFIFLEFFIVAEGAYFNRLLKVLKAAAARGVEVKWLYDDLGCQGLFGSASKKQLKKSGIKLKAFSPLLSFFNFALNYRDHRKVVVVDGKTSYICGFNIADECVNERERQCCIWKDAGLKLGGAAVDGMSLMFLRQWDFATKSKSGWDKYLNRYEKVSSPSVVVPYSGGPDLEEFVCCGAYANAVSGAGERIYIMSPYLVPDGSFLELLRRKAMSGVDVRVVLPGAADWEFVYGVTRANAQKLFESGVKIYFVENTFAHSKVMLTENCAIVGSVNMDMRSFFLEYDNAVYTNDEGVMDAVNSDFEGVFAENAPVAEFKRSLPERVYSGFWKIFSPLM